MLQYSRVGITVKSGLNDKCATVDCIVRIVQSTGATVFMDKHRTGGVECATDLPVYEDEDEIDLLLAIGGDGTVLRAVRSLSHCAVPILSVNRGTVGFLAELEYDEAEKMIPILLSGGGVLDRRQLLHVHVLRNDRTLFEGFALNEVVVAQGTIARLVDLHTSVNGEELTTFHADGLILSTPTGSTAYSLSAGGPIVHPTLEAMIMTPINPHSFSQKPIVIRSDSLVEITVLGKLKKYQDMDVNLTLDGQLYVGLQSGDSIKVTQDDRCVHFLRRKDDTFFHTLRKKLRWGERIVA